jgi:hypothetical protein
MSIDNTTPESTRTAQDFLAQIQEHRQGVDFKLASELLTPQSVNDASRDAITHAHSDAWHAVINSDSERIQSIPALALAEAKEIIVHAALLSLAEYLEDFNANAPERTDVEFEIASLVFLLRTLPVATAPKAEGWQLRGLPSTMRHSGRVPHD